MESDASPKNDDEVAGNQSRQQVSPRVRLSQRASQPVSILPLVLLRIAAGIAVFVWATKLIGDDNYRAIFVLPFVLCKYAGFEWVQVPPGDGMRWVLHGVQAVALASAAGFLTRWTSLLTGLSVAYVLLVERSIYVNHYYLLACVGIWLSLLPSGSYFSMDAWLKPRSAKSTMPAWCLWLIRFQLGMPYIFGAIAKLNWDWLGGQPPRSMLLGEGGIHDWFHLLGDDVPVMMLVYGGILYDALVVPLAWVRRTRWLAVLASLAFHLTNAFLLHIGVFPWFMLATLPVFFGHQWWANSVVRRWQNWFPTLESRPPAEVGKWIQRFAVAYVVVQLILPWRHWVLPGNPSWNERGHRYAWRMMLRHKNSLVHFKLVDKTNGQYLYLPLTTVMTGFQESRASRNPECLRQAAIALSRLASRFGITDSEVYALALVSLNGRKPVPMIDPNVDLLTAQRGWLNDDWVTADPGPFLVQPWLVDHELWWQELKLPDNFRDLQGKTPQGLLDYLHQMNPDASASTTQPTSRTNVWE